MAIPLIPINSVWSKLSLSVRWNPYYRNYSGPISPSILVSIDIIVGVMGPRLYILGTPAQPAVSYNYRKGCSLEHCSAHSQLWFVLVRHSDSLSLLCCSQLVQDLQFILHNIVHNLHSVLHRIPNPCYSAVQLRPLPDAKVKVGPGGKQLVLSFVPFTTDLLAEHCWSQTKSIPVE